MDRIYIYNDIEIKDVKKSSCGRFSYNYEESRKHYDLLHSEYLYFANVPIGKEYLNIELKDHEKVEDEEDTNGDSILNQFYYGNWSQTIKECVYYRIEPQILLEYMQDRAYEFYGDIPIDQESYFSFFDSNFFITYTMEYYSKLRDEDKKRGNDNG
jgi:hypothetical protein